MANSIAADSVAKCLARRDYLDAMNMLTDSKRDSNLLFVRDLKNALSPFLNSCGLLELLSTSLAILNSQTAYDDAILSLRDSNAAEAEESEQPNESIGWLTPEIDSARVEALQAGRDFQNGLGMQMQEIERLSLSIVAALQKLTSHSEKEFDEALGSAIRNGQKSLPVSDVLECFETIERKLDAWDVKVSGLRQVLAKSSSEPSGASPEETGATTQNSRSSKSNLTDEPHLIALDMLDPMERNRKRFSLIMASSLPALSATRLMMVASSIKSGYTPIGTLLPAVYGSSLTETAPESWLEKDSGSTPQPFSLNFAKFAGFNDPGYVNAPLLNVTLTCFVNHLTFGPDLGVDWSRLKGVPELRSLLEEIGARSALPDSASLASRDVRHVFKDVLAVLKDIEKAMAEKAGQLTVANIGLERVQEWRSKLRAALLVSAKYTTAVVIPGISLNTPEWPATDKPSQGLPSLESEIDRRAFLDLGLFRLHADHEIVLNSLAYHQSLADAHKRLKKSLEIPWKRVKDATAGPHSKLGLSRVLDSHPGVSEMLRQHIHSVKAFIVALTAMMKVWLPGRENSGDSKSSAASGKSFYLEMKLVSAFLQRSYFELFSEMTKPVRSFLERQADRGQSTSETRANGQCHQTASADLEQLQQTGSRLALEVISPYLVSLEARKEQLEELFQRIGSEDGVKIDGDVLEAIRQGTKHVRDSCLATSLQTELQIPSLRIS